MCLAECLCAHRNALCAPENLSKIVVRPRRCDMSQMIVYGTRKCEGDASPSFNQRREEYQRGRACCEDKQVPLSRRAAK